MQKTALLKLEKSLINLTRKLHITPNHGFFKECRLLAIASKNLYNVCLYSVRQHYFETNSLFVEDDYPIYTKTTLYHKFKDHECYRTNNHPEIQKHLPTKVLKQTQIQVEQNVAAFRASLKSFYKDPSKFNGKPKIPGYLKKYNVVTFPKDALSFKTKGFVSLSMTDIKLPLGDLTREQILEVKIVPQRHGFTIHINYKKEIPELGDIKQVTTFAGLDIGLNNLCALASNDPSIPSLIINGRPLKSINQYYNKQNAKFKKNLPKTMRNSRKMDVLGQKRKHKIDDYLHLVSCRVIEYLVKYNIKCLVVGNNKEWKQNINMGKRNNQAFVCIPFQRFRDMLKYKCALAGIIYIEREESYTSKCSFLDSEPVKKHTQYVGRRDKRGMFTASDGTKINADINGALNILRKEMGNGIFPDVSKFRDLHIIKRSC